MRTDAGDSVTGSKSRKASSYVQGPRPVPGKGWEVELRDGENSRTETFSSRQEGKQFVRELLAAGEARRQLRGFAVMPMAQRQAIASMGGKAAHASGKAYHYTSEAAQLAGRRGGAAVAQDRQHMADIGRKGGIERGRRARARREQRGKRARAEA